MTARRANSEWRTGASVGRLPRLPMAAMLAALTLVLAGCGGINEQTLGEDELAFFVHGPQLPSGGNDAEVVGTLATGDGCILLDQDGNRFPVVWPSGTSVETTDPLVLELPSGEQLREGDQVSGGGGYPYADTLDIDVPEACLNEWGEVAVFNPDDDPTVADTAADGGVAPSTDPTGSGEDAVSVSRGAEHCGWESVRIIRLSTDVAPPHTEGDQWVDFVRDTDGVLPERLVFADFEADAARPDDAASTGHQTPYGELWLAPSEPDVAYLVTDGITQQWPAAYPGCD